MSASRRRHFGKLSSTSARGVVLYGASIDLLVSSPELTGRHRLSGGLLDCNTDNKLTDSALIDIGEGGIPVTGSVVYS